MAQSHGNFSAKTVTETMLDIPSTTWTALPTTAQTGRQVIEVYNKGTNKLYFSFDSSATYKQRAAIGRGEFRIFPIQDNVTLYGRPQGGGTRVVVTEYR